MSETDRGHILLVEDSATQAIQMRRSLEASGFSVDCASTAESALDTMNSRLPDLVIADYHLPGMNGDELSRQIRLNVRTRALPVLMLTEARELERQGLQSGADAYVAKSAGQDLLILRINALLRGRSKGAGAPHPERRRGLAQGSIFRRAAILVVDTSATFRTHLQHLLAQEGHDATFAGSPQEALDAVATVGAAWDCVVVNLLSPGFDGIDTCRRLNQLRAASGEDDRFQIIAFGSDGTAGPSAEIDGFEAGADDVVPVSADPDVLGIRIRTLIRRKLLKDENRRIEAELREQGMAVERAKAETAAAEARASLAEALARANAELEDANRQLKDAQAKLVQAAKMASLGELVAGIAHEINNPLAFILAHQGTVERLLGEIEAGGDGTAPAIAKARQRTASMRIGLERIQDLVLNLRKFSRLDGGEFQTVAIGDAIETVLALLSHKLGERIEVVRRFEADDLLYCSPALLNQVVMNIVGNAADAIDGPGTITIATRQDEETYTLTISDSGPGIPADLRERIFEPFFTTKPIGSGTGLGLAIAYGVVQAHEGTISVDSTPQGGARFTIAVPRRIGQ